MLQEGLDQELIVLLGPDGKAIGTAPKRASHHRHTPLHLAFSCYIVTPSGRVLVTRRAAHKATFQSMWTNSCCGHPAPGEALREAVRRRVQFELCLQVTDITLVPPPLQLLRHRARRCCRTRAVPGRPRHHHLAAVP